MRDEAEKRAFEALVVIGFAPRRAGDLMYLAGHMPLLPGHTRRFGCRSRGYSALLIPLHGEPSLIKGLPSGGIEYIKDVYADNDLASALKKRYICAAGPGEKTATAGDLFYYGGAPL